MSLIRKKTKTVYWRTKTSLAKPSRRQVIDEPFDVEMEFQEEPDFKDMFATIISDGSYGIVDGVEIDLRHPDLPVGEWRVIGMEYNLTHSFFWLPSFGTFDPEEVRARLKEEASDSDPIWSWTDEQLEDAVYERTPKCLVSSGDKVEIAEVERLRIGEQFDSLHDREIRLAHLRVIRKSGQIEVVPTPIRFAGTTAALRNNYDGRYYEILAQRIRKHFGLNSLNDMNRIEYQESYEFEALGFANLIDEYYGDLRSADLRDIPITDIEPGEVVDLIEYAVAMGYFWANAEARIQGTKRFAESAKDALDGASRAGVKSGAKRREKAATTWQPEALRLANKIRANVPNISRNRLAVEINFQWQDPNVHAPEPETIKKFLAQNWGRIS